MVPVIAKAMRMDLEELRHGSFSSAYQRCKAAWDLCFGASSTPLFICQIFKSNAYGLVLLCRPVRLKHPLLDRWAMRVDLHFVCEFARFNCLSAKAMRIKIFIVLWNPEM